MSPTLDKRGELREEEEKGGWAPGRWNSGSTRRRRSRGNRPLGRRSYGRRTARSLGHRKRRSTGGGGGAGRAPGGGAPGRPVTGVGRAAGGGGGRRTCVMRASFSRARHRPPKVAGGVDTQKNTGPFTGYPCGLIFGPNSVN
jgi:hypothetical protein